MNIDRRSFLLTTGLATAGLLVGAATAAAAPPGMPTPPMEGGESPIDIPIRAAVRDPRLPQVQVSYPGSVDLRVRYVSRDPARDPSGCATRGREETIEAAVPAGAAFITLGGARYDLLQFHFHTLSEHRFDGRQTQLEQHFVHRGPNGETLVIGYLLDGGGPGGTDVDAVLREIPVECGEEVEVSGVDLAVGLPRDLSTFRYTGSLTSSPYTQPVAWLVLRQTGRVADATIASFRGVFPDGDARDPQPLGRRTVYLAVQPR